MINLVVQLIESKEYEYIQFDELETISLENYSLAFFDEKTNIVKFSSPFILIFQKI